VTRWSKLPVIARRVLVLILIASGLTYLFADSICLLGLDVWMHFLRHADIELIAYDSEGKRMSAEGFFRTWRPALFVRDLEGCPLLGVQHGLGKILVAVPPNQPVSLEILWPVPGFGKLLVSADNQGSGYIATGTRTPVIELGPELARSRIDQALRWITSHNRDGVAVLDSEPELQTAQALLHKAELNHDPSVRAQLALESLRHSLRGSENEVLREARQSIELHRRGRLEIAVTDHFGRPISHARLVVEQSHFDFRFGVHHDGYDPESLERLREAGVNDGVLYLDWKEIEPHPGQFDFEALDRGYPPSLTRDGFRLRAHALAWLASGELPAYMTTVRGEVAAITEQTQVHVAHVVEHFKDRVQIWEANNEGNAAWAKWGLNDREVREVIKASANTIHRLAPQSEILINLALPLGEDLSFKDYPFVGLLTDGRISSLSSDPYQFIQQLSREEVPFDSVGLQFYNGTCVGLYGGIQVPAIDLFRFAQELQRYGRLGKRLYVTEIAAGSAGCTWPGKSWWHSLRNEQTQADYLEGVFTIAYADRDVDGITWWDLYDADAFVEGGGLFDRYMRPKAAYTRLLQLLKGWSAERTLETDSAGLAVFEGDAGDYQVTSRYHDVASSMRVHLRAESSDTAVFSLNDAVTSPLAPSRVSRNERSAVTRGLRE
jgi:GH35 family endo-1,4-beta-xylanase